LNKWERYILNDSYFNPNLSPHTRVVTYAEPPKALYSWKKKRLPENMPSTVSDSGL